jgi:hypothetical protein
MLLSGVRKYRFNCRQPHIKPLFVRGRAAPLIREAQDKRQGSTASAHVLVAETPDFLSDPFTSDGDRLIGHHLRREPQSIFGPGINGDSKIRSIRQLGRQLVDHD